AAQVALERTGHGAVVVDVAADVVAALCVEVVGEPDERVGQDLPPAAVVRETVMVEALAVRPLLDPHAGAVEHVESVAGAQLDHVAGGLVKPGEQMPLAGEQVDADRKSTRLNSVT